MPEITSIANQILLKRRLDKKLQTEFADESHISVKTLGKLEKSSANPRLKTMKRIAVKMDMSVSDLVKTRQLHEAQRHTCYAPDDPQDISAEIAALALWLSVFLHFTGETQQKFSDNAGVCLDTVGRIKRESPSCNPTLATLQRFAAYMSVTVAELLDTTLGETDMVDILKERIGKHD